MPPAPGTTPTRIFTKPPSKPERSLGLRKGQGRDALDGLLEALGNGDLGVRGRLHAVWIIAHLGDHGATAELFKLAEHDVEPRVRAQAVRALADLSDPVIRQHRLDAGRGDPQLAERLAALGTGEDPRVLLEVVVALGRLRWVGAANWLERHLEGRRLENPDGALTHAAAETLRRSRSCPAAVGTPSC